jgi:hypothetical protein
MRKFHLAMKNRVLCKGDFAPNAQCGANVYGSQELNVIDVEYFRIANSFDM